MRAILSFLMLASAAANCDSLADDFYAQRSDIDRVEFTIGDFGTLPVLISDGEYSGKLEWAPNAGVVEVQARALHSSADCTLYESSPLNVTLPAGNDTVSVRMQLLNLLPRPSEYNKRPIIVLTTVSPQRAVTGQEVLFFVEARDYSSSDSVPTVTFAHNGSATLNEQCVTDGNARLCQLTYVIASDDSGTLQLSITASDGELQDTATVLHEVVTRSSSLDGTFFINEGPYLTDITEGNTLLSPDGETSTTHSAKIHDETATNLTFAWTVEGNSTYCDPNDVTFSPALGSNGLGSVSAVGDTVSVTHTPSTFPPSNTIDQYECDITLTATDELGQSVTTDFVHLVSTNAAPEHPYITLVYHSSNSTHRMSLVRAHSPYDNALTIHWESTGFASSDGDAAMTRTGMDVYEWQHAIAIDSNVQGSMVYDIVDDVTELHQTSVNYTINAHSGQRRLRSRRLAEAEADNDDTLAATVSISSTGATVQVEHEAHGTSDTSLTPLGISLGAAVAIFLVSTRVRLT